MVSLLRIYRSLFQILTTESVILENSHIYTIKFDEKEGLTSSQQSFSAQLENVFYYCFIHLILGILIKEKAKERISDLEKIISKFFQPLNWDLLRFLERIFSDPNRSTIYFLNYQKFTFKLRESELREIQNILKDKNYQLNEYDALYTSIVEIQYSTMQINNQIDINMVINEKERKEKGKYYTSPLITDFITKMFFKILAEDETIHSVLDPSCGSGLFLLSILQNRIIMEKFKSRKLHLEGWDIDIKSLLTASLILLNFYLENIITEINLSISLQKVDFLTNHYKTGEKFDLIMTNPPYIRERFFDKEYRTKLTRYETYKGKSDLYFAFIEQSINYLTPHGYIAFLIPRYWLESNFGSSVRKFIIENFAIKVLMDFRSFKLFSLGIHSSILIACKQKAISAEEKDFQVYTIHGSNKSHSVVEVIQKVFDLANEEEISTDLITKTKIKQTDLTKQWVLQGTREKELLEKMQKAPGKKLNELVLIREGINTGADKIAKHHVKHNPTFSSRVGEGIFVLSTSELEHLGLTIEEKESFIKKWIKGKDIESWKVKEQNSWLVYFKQFDKLPKQIQDHLEEHKEILEQRAEIKRNKRRNWFELAWPRKEEIFETKPKLLMRYKAKKPIVAIDETGYYTSADFRVLLVKKTYNIYTVAGLLNSNVFRWQINKIAKKLGTIQDYYSYTLENTILRYPTPEKEEMIINKVKEITSFVHQREIKDSENNNQQDYLVKLESELNDLIYELFEIDKEEKALIEQTIR